MAAESSNRGRSRSHSQSHSHGQFPFGMRVLIVDDDIISLRAVEFLLLRCGYLVTATLNALTALRLLRENRDNYDLVISDVRMPDMDGFGLLEAIGLEMDVPVINGEVSTVMKGIMHGAVDYLVKPVRLEELRLIWKHVVKRSLHDMEANNPGGNHHPGRQLEYCHEEDLDDNNEIELDDDRDRKLETDHEKEPDDDHTKKIMRKGKHQRKEKDGKEKESSSDDPSTQKKARFIWSPEMHAQFLRAVNQLGIDRAVPKKIRDLMNVPGLTRENIASHLQKYRLAIRKNGIGMSQQYYGGFGPTGSGGSRPGSILFSFNQPLHSNVNTLGGLKASEHQTQHAINLFGHFQNSPYGLSQMTPACLPPSLNHQEGVHQQFTSNPQASPLIMQQFRYASNPSMVGTSGNQSGFQGSGYQSLAMRPNQVDGYMQNLCSSSRNPGPSSGLQPGHLLNPSMMGTSNPQSVLNGLSCRSRTSMPDQVDGFMQNSSYDPSARNGHPGPSSGFHPGCSSNDHLVDYLFNDTDFEHSILEDNTLADLNAIIPVQLDQGQAIEYTRADVGMQVSGDSVDLQSHPDGEEFKGINNPDSTNHPSEHSPSEVAFDPDKCGSMEDLDTFFKQFGQ